MTVLQHGGEIMKKIYLITGASGHVGSALCACLKERGIAVPEPAAPAGHPHGGCPGMLAKKLAAKPAGKPPRSERQGYG